MTEDAERIATILSDTNTVDRGDLLLQVAEILTSRKHFYTASVIRHAGELYNDD